MDVKTLGMVAGGVAVAAGIAMLVKQRSSSMAEKRGCPLCDGMDPSCPVCVEGAVIIDVPESMSAVQRAFRRRHRSRSRAQFAHVARERDLNEERELDELAPAAAAAAAAGQSGRGDSSDDYSTKNLYDQDDSEVMHYVRKLRAHVANPEAAAAAHNRREIQRYLDSKDPWLPSRGGKLRFLGQKPFPA